MDAAAEKLEWDSSFFGFGIGRVVGARMDDEIAASVQAWGARHAIRCVYFLCDASDVESVWAAGRNGFRLVDVRVTFTRTLEGDESHPAGARVRPCREGDLDALRAIARDSYEATRFQSDPHFPRARARQLYEVWVERSCHGYADLVLVAETDNGPAGFVTCHADGESGRIGLVGVSAAAQGLGLGRQLVAAALAFFASRSARQVEVATQVRNLQAQRLYQRCGFVTTAAQLWFHRWFEEVPSA